MHSITKRNNEANLMKLKNLIKLLFYFYTLKQSKTNGIELVVLQTCNSKSLTPVDDFRLL